MMFSNGKHLALGRKKCGEGSALVVPWLSHVSITDQEVIHRRFIKRSTVYLITATKVLRGF